MADYFPVLSRAVAGLENNTGEARRAVYERARAAIVRQLRAIDPPLSEEDIARERMNLEEAIRRVEGDAPAPPAPAARPAPPPRPAEPQPPRPAAPANVDQPRREPSVAAPQRPAPGPKNGPAGGPAPLTAERPAKRADGRPIVRAAGEGAPERSRRPSGPVVALVALILIGGAAGVFAARNHISGLLGGGAKTTQQTADTPSSTPAAPSDQASKTDERAPQDGVAPQAPEPAPAPQQQAAEPQPVPQEQVARQEPAPTETPAPAPTVAPAAPPSSQSGPLVAQRATLYEEGPNQQSGEALAGTVVWRTESVSGGQGAPLETAIRGDIDIPGRKLKATMVIRRNADATLPASHTVEIQFDLPPDFANAGVANVPGVVMKADEAARGATVAGLSVRVTTGFFLIGLSNLDTERSVNEQLLRDRGWIDVPILYDNGRRAVLTLEKGQPGTQAFNDAFNSWHSGSAAQQAPQP